MPATKCDSSMPNWLMPLDTGGAQNARAHTAPISSSSAIPARLRRIPTALLIARMVKAFEPATLVIYGGVFPTYHWRDILAATDVFDFIVRGEGEATVVALVEALEMKAPPTGRRHRYRFSRRSSAAPSRRGRPRPSPALDAYRASAGS